MYSRRRKLGDLVVNSQCKRPIGANEASTAWWNQGHNRAGHRLESVPALRRACPPGPEDRSPSQNGTPRIQTRAPQAHSTPNHAPAGPGAAGQQRRACHAGRARIPSAPAGAKRTFCTQRVHRAPRLANFVRTSADAQVPRTCAYPRSARPRRAGGRKKGWVGAPFSGPTFWRVGGGVDAEAEVGSALR